MKRLFATIMVMLTLLTVNVYADEPKIIMDGKYVTPQANAIDISEPPPISNVSKALDAMDDALDDCPYNDAVPMDRSLQRYLWKKCKAATGDYKNLYSFMLGLIDQESEFNPRAVSRTNDYGLTQTNKKYVFPDAKKALGLNDITD